jgi:hypothetical protein
MTLTCGTVQYLAGSPGNVAVRAARHRVLQGHEQETATDSEVDHHLGAPIVAGGVAPLMGRMIRGADDVMSSVGPAAQPQGRAQRADGDLSAAFLDQGDHDRAVAPGRASIFVSHQHTD